MAELPDADKAKMRKAQILIREKHYEEARALLLQVDHPRATDWILRLDPLIGERQKAEREGNTRRVLIIIFVIVIVVGAVAYQIHQQDVESEMAARRYVCSLTYMPQSEAWYRCLNEP